jgi:hypothetical protein
MLRILQALLLLSLVFALGALAGRMTADDAPFQLPSITSITATLKSALPAPSSTPSAVPSMHASMRIPKTIWPDPDMLDRLPTQGPAWVRLTQAANQPIGLPDLTDQDNEVGVLTLARALVYARTKREEFRIAAVSSCMLARAGELPDNTLAAGKQLLPYILAADLIELPREKRVLFRVWLQKILSTTFSGGKTLRSTHEIRPNNWGTFAGASRLAAAMYLGNEAEVRRCAEVFRGWLGHRQSHSGFRFKDRSWQADPNHPVGINPAGATREGHSIDGVLPDDMRRAGGFTWPPPRENYVYTALQGAVAQAVLLDRCGYPVWEWQDRALLRAFTWLHAQAGYPARGDDGWLPYVINHFYGTDFPAPPPHNVGKNLDWTDWIYQPAPASGSEPGTD